tara:strand:+ start:400 stop:831 length:432 start_codon:yes stop_codon:yes gene_type:complete
MSKCPVCGYDTNRNYNYSKDILKMLTAMNSQTLKYVKRLVKDVQQNIPSEYNQKSYFFFLKSIEKSNPRLIERAIEQYIKAGYHLQGKGFAYIKAMILNENKNVAKKAANEYKRLGRVPKIIKLKGDEINEKRSRTTKNKKSK